MKLFGFGSGKEDIVYALVWCITCKNYRSTWSTFEIVTH